MDEATYSVVRSLIMPPLDGGGGEKTRPVQQTICNHTDLLVGLLGKPGDQATAHKFTTEDGRP